MGRSDGISTSTFTAPNIVPDVIEVIPVNAISVTNVHVQARSLGHFKNILYKTGEQFYLDNMTQYGTWMKKIS